jgi:hypothetical protein
LFSNTNQYHIGVVTLPPKYTVQLQQRARPSSIGNKSSVTDVIVIGPFLENRPHSPPRPFHRGAGCLNVYTSGPGHRIQSVGVVVLMRYKCKYLLHAHTHTHKHTHTHHTYTHTHTHTHTHKAIMLTGLPRNEFKRRNWYFQFRGLKYEVFMAQILWRMLWHLVDGYIGSDVLEEPTAILVLPTRWCQRLSTRLRGTFRNWRFCKFGTADTRIKIENNSWTFQIILEDCNSPSQCFCKKKPQTGESEAVTE